MTFIYGHEEERNDQSGQDRMWWENAKIMQLSANAKMQRSGVFGQCGPFPMGHSKDKHRDKDVFKV